MYHESYSQDQDEYDKREDDNTPLEHKSYSEQSEKHKR